MHRVRVERTAFAALLAVACHEEVGVVAVQAAWAAEQHESEVLHEEVGVVAVQAAWAAEQHKSEVLLAVEQTLQVAVAVVEQARHPTSR